MINRTIRGLCGERLPHDGKRRGLTLHYFN